MEEILIWGAILIPLIGMYIAHKFFNERFTIWEYFLPPITVFVFILAFTLIIKSSLETDTEYLGSVITKARYTEYYETYVHKTCTRTYSCGTAKHPRTCTQTYDCSYCDKNPEHWDIMDNLGNWYSISREQYNTFRKNWNNETFIDLHRSITHGGWGCGEDGDAKETYWDGNIYTTLNITKTHSYTNPTLNALSAFHYKDFTEEEVKLKGLYDYPKNENLYQSNILGLKVNDSINKMYQYLNGYYGSTRKARFYYLFFKNKSINTGRQQENYWKKGNQNEINICIGIDNFNKIQWVYCFGWNNNKILYVNLRDDIMNLGILDLKKIHDISINNIKDYYIINLEKQFSYLKPEFPSWVIKTVYFVSILLTALLIFFGYKNDIN